MILLRDRHDPRIYWVRRHEEMAFQGGFHAFPGGQAEPDDAGLPLLNGGRGEADRARVTAIRELFEETGVLLARGADDLGPRKLNELRRRVAAGESFADLIGACGLEIDASDLAPAGRWVTPAFSLRRFDTWFFTAWLPEGQEPSIGGSELDVGEWIHPAAALAEWERGRILAAPPITHALRRLAGGLHDLEARLTSIPEARGGDVRKIEFKPGIVLFPVRTPTKPPATHTNCYLIGRRQCVVVDPATPYEDEQAALCDYLESRRAEGCELKEILLTHQHPDHVAATRVVAERFRLPVAAHPLTAEKLPSWISVARRIEDGECWRLDGEPALTLRAVLTPGHARGHLCYYEEFNRTLISGDLVVGLGTVVIDPPEGDMRDYLDSLEKVKRLAPAVIMGGHGPAVGSPLRKLDEYISHRLAREASVLAAVAAGNTELDGVVRAVYTDVSADLHPLAARSTLAHLIKLEAEGRVSREGDTWRLAGDAA